MDGNQQYWNDKLGRGAARKTTLLYRITAAKTYEKLEGNASHVSADAITDAAVAAFLGLTASPHTAAAFDATSMGNDAFGGVVDFGGQVQRLLGMRATLLEITTGVVVRGCEASSALTATSLKTECALGTDYNVGFKVNFGNSPDFDGITAGLIAIEIFWISK